VYGACVLCVWSMCVVCLKCVFMYMECVVCTEHVCCVYGVCVLCV
jgi:hypothetical protein